MYFPPHSAGNQLRGRMGLDPVFATLVSPPPREDAPSGFKDVPRALVIRARHLEGQTFEPGQPFDFRLHCFGTPPTRHFLRETASDIRIEFLSPTDLKGAQQPDFGVLFRRIHDRVSALAWFYGPGPIDSDYTALAARADGIETVRSDIEHVVFDRTSSRTGQTHGIGGFMGTAEYRGDLSDLIPWLRAAEWTGVGRHTVWGNGEIRLTILSPS